MSKYLKLIILLLFTCLVSGSCQKQPIALCRVNPHYFQFRGKPAILITSGEHYGSVLNRDFDYKTYLDELHSRGFNCTRTMTGIYVEFPGWFNYSADQPLSPSAGRVICPWARSRVPGYINGGNKFDLTKWDDAYFKRLKDFLSQASKRGIVVELTLFCPYYDAEKADHDLMWKYSPVYYKNNINGVGENPRKKVLMLDNSGLTGIQEAYVRKLVTELKDFDNLIYEICNEPYIQNLVQYEWMAHLSQVIVNTESGFRYQHLQSQNVANGVAVIGNPLPHASVFNFHYSNSATVKLNYGMNNVIGNNETDGFEPNNVARTNAWEFVIGGGGLFNNLDMSFTTTNASGGSPKGERAALRSQLGILKKFIEGFDFVRMKPDSTVVAASISQPLLIRVLAQRGVAYAVWLRKNDLKVNKLISAELLLNLPEGRYKLSWMDPMTGKKIGKVIIKDHAGGEMKLVSPLFSLDLALGIRKNQ